LWVIAAIAATLLVCSQAPEAPPSPAEPAGLEVEIEVVQ
jgi:hypothetical protein